MGWGWRRIASTTTVKVQPKQSNIHFYMIACSLPQVSHLSSSFLSFRSWRWGRLRKWLDHSIAARPRLKISLKSITMMHWPYYRAWIARTKLACLRFEDFIWALQLGRSLKSSRILVWFHSSCSAAPPSTRIASGCSLYDLLLRILCCSMSPRERQSQRYDSTDGTRSRSYKSEVNPEKGGFSRRFFEVK